MAGLAIERIKLMAPRFSPITNYRCHPGLCVKSAFNSSCVLCGHSMGATIKLTGSVGYNEAYYQEQLKKYQEYRDNETPRKQTTPKRSIFFFLLQLFNWFPRLSKLRAENKRLTIENEKLLKESSHVGAYR